MASVARSASGKRWRARYRDPEGKQRSRTFDRKVDAEKFLVGLEHAKLSGTYIEVNAGDITFKDVAEKWRRAQIHRPSTVESVEIMLRRHAYPKLGARPIGKIRPSEVQEWVKSLEDVLAPSTIETVARYVVSIFKMCVKDRLIAFSPADDLKVPKKERTAIVPLKVDQVLAIADAIQPRYSALVMLLAGTGLRPAEAFGLTNDRIDWLRKLVNVNRQMVTIGGGAQFGPPKTGASVRSVPVPAFLIDLLAKHVSEFALGDDHLIFSDAEGHAIRRNRFGEVWRQAMKSLDFECRGPHQLRHHYASLLIQHGESVKVVQARLGHASASETLDTYAHLWPNSEESTRAAVESAYLDGAD